jgi:zinc transport system permease protein
MNFITLLTNYEFLQNAIIGSLLASIACGLIGPFVHVKKISHIAGGISHSTLGGMGIAYFFNKSPSYGAVGTSILAGLLIGYFGKHSEKEELTITNSIWATGMALGILFISQTPGYQPDLMKYLFGNILLIPRSEIYFMIILDVVLIAIINFFFKPLIAICFDEEFSRLRGLQTTLYYYLLIILISLTCVLLIQIVGLILVIALLTLPAAISNHFTQTFSKLIIISMIIGSLFSLLGIAISFEYNLPSGPIIILLLTTGYFLSYFYKKKLQKK